MNKIDQQGPEPKSTCGRPFVGRRILTVGKKGATYSFWLEI